MEGYKVRLAILTNILAPYRIPLFERIGGFIEESDIILMAEREENRQWELQRHTFKTHLLPGIHWKPPGHDVSFHFNWGTFALLRRLGPDAVVSGGFTLANLSAFIYCKLFGKPFIPWGEMSEVGDIRNAGLIRRTLRRILIRWSEGAIGSTSEARGVFEHYGAKKDRILVSCMPIDVDFYHRLSEEFRGTEEWKEIRSRYSRPILLSVGQLTDRKGYKELFEIYEKILVHIPTASILIVGDGPQRADLEKLVLNRGWRNVHFTGFQQPATLIKYLSVADLFIFHTLHDPFGAVVTEAMSAGLPVVSSIYGAVTTDFVQNGVSGYCIDPRNAEQSAEAILRALRMTEAQKEIMVEKAYARAAMTTFDSEAERMTRFVESLCQERVGIRESKVRKEQ